MGFGGNERTDMVFNVGKILHGVLGRQDVVPTCPYS